MDRPDRQVVEVDNENWSSPASDRTASTSVRSSRRVRVRPSALAVRLTIVFGLTAIYAACFVLIKAGSRFAPDLAFAGMRTVIAGAALLALVVALRQPLLPPRGSWPWILALALTSTAGAYGAMFVSPGRAGAGIASVLGNLQPIFIVVLAALALGERMTRLSWLTSALGAAGAVLIAAPALAGGDAYGVSGPVLALAASFGFAAGSVLIKRLNPRSGLLALTGWQLLIGSLPLLAASVVYERDAAIVWNARFLAALLFLALVGTSLATAVWYWLVQREELGRLTVFLYLVPVFGLALSLAVYGERIGVAEGAGVALVLGGVGVAMVESWRAGGPPSPKPAAAPAATVRPLAPERGSCGAGRVSGSNR